MNLKVEVTVRLDLNVPAGVTPELVAAVMGEATEGMLEAFAVARGVSKAAPVKVILGPWHAANDDGTFTGTIG